MYSAFRSVVNPISDGLRMREPARTVILRPQFEIPVYWRNARILRLLFGLPKRTVGLENGLMITDSPGTGLREGQHQ